MTSGVLATALTTLACAFILSGALKFRSTPSTLLTMESLLVPEPLRRTWIAALLPWLELALGLGLVTLSTWPLVTAALLAAGILSVFTLFLGAALVRHDDVDCNCFGAPEPVTIWSVLRNAILIAAAVAVAAGVTDHRGVIAQVATLNNEELTWFIVTTLGVAAFVLLWHRTSASRRSRGTSPLAAPPGEPDTTMLELIDASGEPTTITSLTKRRAALLVFVRPDCAPCSQVVARLDEWSAELDGIEVVPVITKSPTQFREVYPDLEVGALYAPKYVHRELGIQSVPAAMLFSTNGAIAAGPELGPEAIEALIGGIRQALDLNRSQNV